MQAIKPISTLAQIQTMLPNS
ncbi:MAG: hypothetical protein RLZ21_367, partial [Pseudomonadota bacterium]